MMTTVISNAARYFPGRFVLPLCILIALPAALGAQTLSFGEQPADWNKPQAPCEKPPALREPLDAVYPASAMEARQQGIVIVGTYIDKRGAATYGEVKSSSGFPALDSAALAAVKRGYFKACWREGAPRGARLTVPVEFRLPDTQDWSVDKDPETLKGSVEDLKRHKSAVEAKMRELEEEIRRLRARKDSIREAKNEQPSP